MSLKNFMSYEDAEEILGEYADNINSLKSGLTNVESKIDDATVYPYADVITIPDAVPSNLADCSVKIEPVQDLHGYDKPWVGGAGKNKLPLTVDIVKSLNGGGTWTGNTYHFRDVDFTINTDSDGNVTSVKVNGTASQNVTLLLDFVGTASTEYYIGGCPTNGGNNTFYFDTFADGVARTADYGSGATFTANGNSQYVRIGVQQGYNAQNLMFYPMICLNSETDKSFAPYTNICPISGHTEASVQRDGKNLAFKKISGYTINANGVIEALATYNIFVGRVKKGQTYTVTKSSDYEVYAFYTTEPSAGSTSYDGSRVTLQEEADYYTIIAPIDGYIAFRTNVGFNNGQLELGSSATDYEPYQGKTYTIALGDTIYGGTVDFDSGVMTVMRKGVDLGLLDFTYDESQRFTTVVSDMKSASIREAHFITSCYLTIDDGRPYSQVPDFSAYAGWNGAAMSLSLHDSRYSDAATYKTAITGQTICYELATPTTIQLTPQQIQLLKGQNTLTASTGDISVTVNGVSGAIGSLTSDKQDKTDYALETTEKTVVGAINEIKDSLATVVPTPASDVTITKGGYVKIGDLVLVDFYFTVSGTHAANTRIAILPSTAVNNASLPIYNITDETTLSGGRMYETGLFAGDALVADKTYNARGLYVKA